MPRGKSFRPEELRMLKKLRSGGRVALVVGLLAVGVHADVAQAQPIYCSRIWYSTANNGDANSEGCSHSTTPLTRLVAECDTSPFRAYSAAIPGPYRGASFDTASCQWGVDSAFMAHY